MKFKRFIFNNYFLDYGMSSKYDMIALEAVSSKKTLEILSENIEKLRELAHSLPEKETISSA